jgi:hypothetical protein
MYSFLVYLLSLLVVTAGALASDVASTTQALVTSSAAAAHATPAIPSNDRVEAAERGRPATGPDAEAIPALGTVDADEAERIVYVEDATGVAILDGVVSPHVHGRPVDAATVDRRGGGLRIFDADRLAAEVALQATPTGPVVDWVWAPASYYAVTFPSLGIGVTGPVRSAKALRIRNVDRESPAHHAGIRPGTRILSIGGADDDPTPLLLRDALRTARADDRPLQLQVQSAADVKARTVYLDPDREASFSTAE